MTNKTTSHYVLITDFPSFIRSQLTKHKQSITIYKRCFKYYTGETKNIKLVEHKIYCEDAEMKEVTIKRMPKVGETMQFEYPFYSHPIQFVAFAKFESILEKLEETQPGNSNQQRRKTTIQKEAKHKVIAYTYYIITNDNQLYKEPAKYVGEDAAQHFYNSSRKVPFVGHL